jgi:hypothetical protein
MHYPTPGCTKTYDRQYMTRSLFSQFARDAANTYVTGQGILFRLTGLGITENINMTTLCVCRPLLDEFS